MLKQNVLILFGLIVIAASKSLNSDNVEVSDLQRLLKSLQKYDKVESSHKNHHKRHHKNHHGELKHDDDQNLMNIHTLNLVFNDNNLKGKKHVESNVKIAKDDDNPKETGGYGLDRNNDLFELRPSHDDKTSGDDSKRKRIGYSVIFSDSLNLEHEVVADPEEFEDNLKPMHQDLNFKLLLHGHGQERGENLRCGCSGRSKADNNVKRNNDLRCLYCPPNRADDKRDNNLRCLHCLPNRADDTRDGSLRCGCSGRSRADNNVKINNDLRCLYCLPNRADDKRDNNLRCLYCLPNRADDTRDGSLRCGCSRADDKGDDNLRCGCSRADDLRDDNLRCGCSGAVDLRDDNLRCGCSRADDLRDDNLRCGCSRDDDLRDDNLRCGCRGRSRAHNYDDKKDDRYNDLNCIGDRCGRSGRHDIDSVSKSILDIYGKRYKINNELDAVVLDVDKIDDVLQALDDSTNNDRKSKEDTHTLKYINNKIRPNENRFHESSLMPFMLKQKVHSEREKVSVPESLVESFY